MIKAILATISLLVPSSCLFANEISKKPSEKAVIELKSNKATLTQDSVLDPYQTTTKQVIKIAPPQTIEQSVLSDAHSTNRLNAHLKHDENFKKATLLNPLLDLKATDVGFLLNHAAPSKPVEGYVGTLNEANQQRYALAFDDDNLIYFDIQKIFEPTSKFHAQNANGLLKKTVQLSKQGKVLLSNALKNEIVRNTSNNDRVIEANHISIIDNHIVLDFKELKINHIPERKNYLNTAIHAIQSRGTMHTSDSFLHTKWNIRKNTIHTQQ